MLIHRVIGTELGSRIFTFRRMIGTELGIRIFIFHYKEVTHSALNHFSRKVLVL